MPSWHAQADSRGCCLGTRPEDTTQACSHVRMEPVPKHMAWHPTGQMSRCGRRTRGAWLSRAAAARTGWSFSYDQTSGPPPPASHNAMMRAGTTKQRRRRAQSVGNECREQGPNKHGPGTTLGGRQAGGLVGGRGIIWTTEVQRVGGQDWPGPWLAGPLLAARVVLECSSATLWFFGPWCGVPWADARLIARVRRRGISRAWYRPV